MEFNSFFVENLNSFFKKTQKSFLGRFCSDSLFFTNIDNIIFILLLFLLAFSVFVSTNTIGAFLFAIVFLFILKLLFKENTEIKLSKIDFWIILYYLIVTVSLFASSNFSLSFHGYLKMITYFAFYFSISRLFENNKRKILILIMLVAFLCTLESVIGIIQNSFGVLAISTWQDVSRLNSNEILSRCYGTLKPYNPNLLAGYLIATVSSIFCLGAFSFLKKHKIGLIVSSVSLFATFLAIFYSGCRGAYIALFFMILTAFFGIYKFTNGFSTIKKRFKTIIAVVFSAFTCILLSMPPIYKRIISIFAMRGDSSTSFRMNVYEASFNMFLDNPFLGIGVGNQNFREVYGLYMKTGFDALGAYSVPLEIMVESGIFALVAFVLFLTASLRKCFYIIRNSESNVKIALVFSILLMIIGIMVHGIFDTIYFRPQLQVIFWTYIAILNILTEE